jgi:hypothetical protein
MNAVAAMISLDDGASTAGMAHAREALQTYAASLAELCLRPKLPKRNRVLEFNWLFVAEAVGKPSSQKKCKDLVDMPSAMVAFELICIRLCVAIISLRRADALHSLAVAHPAPDVVAAYKAVAVDITQMMYTYSDSFSRAQLSSLRQGILPMQLQPEWMAVFRSHVNYRLVSYAMPDNVYVTKVAAQWHLRSAGKWLGSPHLAPHQIPVAQRCYDSAEIFYVCQSIRWRCEQARVSESTDADVALNLVLQAITLSETLADKHATDMQPVVDQCLYTKSVLTMSGAVAASDQRTLHWLQQTHARHLELLQ